MHFWRMCLLAILLASGGAVLAQTPRPATRPPAATSAPHITRLPVIPIPIQINDASSYEVVPIQIFFSVDQGKTWRKYKLVEVASDKQQLLEFRPSQDGEYWLTAVRLDETRETGFSLSNLVPQKRIIFDTRLPKVVLTPEVAANGEILISWQATDERLDAASFRLEFQAGGSESDWQPIEIDPRDVKAVEGGIAGSTRFPPPAGARLINVRAEVRDQAKNPGTTQRALALPKGEKSLIGTGVARRLKPIAPETLSAIPPSGSAIPGEPTPATRPAPGAKPLPAGERLGSGAFDAVPNFNQSSPGRLAGYPRDREDVGPVTSAEMTNDSFAPASPETSPGSSPPSEADPYEDQPRLVNKKRFKLYYDIESVGTGGVADVELWGTSDRGRTWIKWGSDPDLKSPLDVDVSSEAVYGFRVVVVGRNGLTSTAPQAGDPADVWVDIDTTAPQCRLTSVTYGRGEDAGKLDIRWEATDAHLFDRPVTILMSDRPESGYSVLAAGLPNSGQYFWPYDPRAPQQMYLRLEVRDAAGNVGSYQTSEPIRVEGLTPKARIRGVAPVETGRSPFRANLLK